MQEFWRRPGYQIAGLLAVAVLVIALARGTGRPIITGMQSLLGRVGTWRPMVMGFYENSGSGPADPGSWPSLNRNWRRIQIVSPYWYRIGASGNLTDDMTDPKVIAFAHQHHLRIWPLIGNAGKNPMYSSATRAAMLSTIDDLVTRHGFDGAFIDFELLSPYARNDLSTFLNGLGQRMHRRGKGVGVAVFPKIAVSKSITDPYDYGALGTVTDSVVIMAYDHHYSGGPPGPVAPLPWVRDNVQYALRYIPRERIYLGIAAYGYNWARGGATQTVSTLQAQALLRHYGLRPQWSQSAQEPHFAYTESSPQTVWYENAKTFSQKLALARASRIGGIAIWRLGYEDPAVWATLPVPRRARPTALGGGGRWHPLRSAGTLRRAPRRPVDARRGRPPGPVRSGLRAPSSGPAVRLSATGHPPHTIG